MNVHEKVPLHRGRQQEKDQIKLDETPGSVVKAKCNVKPTPRKIVCHQTNVQSIEKGPSSRNVKHDDVPIKSLRSNYANTSFEISLSEGAASKPRKSPPSNTQTIPYIEPIESTSKTNLNKFVPRAFAKKKQQTMTFDDQPPPFYDPDEMYEKNDRHETRVNFPLDQSYGGQYFDVRSKSDSDYSLCTSHISSATYTIDSGSTYTLR